MLELPKIVAAISENENLKKDAGQLPAAAFYEKLQQPENTAVWTLFRKYIDVWGERTVAELKLETVTYQQDPLLLVSLLQSYVKQGHRAMAMSDKAHEDVKQAEDLLAGRLKREMAERNAGSAPCCGRRAISCRSARTCAISGRVVSGWCAA